MTCISIAELGINHNGDTELAATMVAAAAAAGADVVKFHTYKAEEVMTDTTPLADYMKKGEAADSFLDMARRFELQLDETRQLQQICGRENVEFLSSPFDVPSVYALAELGVDRLKIPSGELVNPLLLEAAAATKLPLVVSTGMADLDEVRWAVDLLARNRSGPVTLLHCLSQYPAEFCYVNLRVMLTLRKEFGLPVGFSDHTPGIEVAIAAAGLGAEVIEKHFTIDRSLPGPDQAASLEPAEFAAMVQSIRNVEAALGNGDKRPAPPELDNRAIVRKSLVLREAQEVGTVLTREMLTAKRPESGIPAMRIDDFVGRRLCRTVGKNHMLDPDDLE